MFQIYSVLSIYSKSSFLIFSKVCMPKGSRFSGLVSISVNVECHNVCNLAANLRDIYDMAKQNEENLTDGKVDNEDFIIVVVVDDVVAILQVLSFAYAVGSNEYVSFFHAHSRGPCVWLFIHHRHTSICMKRMATKSSALAVSQRLR